MHRAAIFLFATLFTLSASRAMAGGGDEKSVKLIHAEGKIFYSQTYITWSTEFERVSCEFIIEASTDGNNWVIRGRSHGKGISENLAEYSFVDARDDKYKYYRIRELDPRGSAVLSQFEPENYSINVVLDQVQVNKERKIVLEYTVDQDQELMVRVFNKIGQQVVTRLMPFKKAGDYIYQLDVSDLTPGNYLLVVTQVLLDKSVAEQQITIR